MNSEEEIPSNSLLDFIKEHIYPNSRYAMLKTDNLCRDIKNKVLQICRKKNNENIKFLAVEINNILIDLIYDLTPYCICGKEYIGCDMITTDAFFRSLYYELYKTAHRETMKQIKNNMHIVLYPSSDDMEESDYESD